MALSNTSQEQFEATAKTIAGLIASDWNPTATSSLQDPWNRFTKTLNHDALDTPKLHKACDLVSKFIIDLAHKTAPQIITEPQVLPALSTALEIIINAAYELNELNKPQALRNATRRAYITGISSAFCIVILAWISWTSFIWLSPKGIVVTYYNGTNFERRVTSRVIPKLAIDYGTDRPAIGVKRNGWSARWNGYLVVPTDADYAFYVQNMDGVRLFIDNRCLIDNWHEQNWQTSGRHANIHLDKGPHRLTIEHYNLYGPAGIRVRWMGGGIPANSIIETPYLRKR
jgi:hypothetical protein